MITTHVREVAERRGLTTAYQLQKGLGVSPDVAARLWQGTFTRLDLATLDRLCEFLKCAPGTLIKHKPGDAGE
jgi:DNA-binding Xre family transcriptional regulator